MSYNRAPFMPLSFSLLALMATFAILAFFMDNTKRANIGTRLVEFFTTVVFCTLAVLTCKWAHARRGPVCAWVSAMRARVSAMCARVDAWWEHVKYEFRAFRNDLVQTFYLATGGQLMVLGAVIGGFSRFIVPAIFKAILNREDLVVFCIQFAVMCTVFTVGILTGGAIFITGLLRHVFPPHWRM